MHENQSYHIFVWTAIWRCVHDQYDGSDTVPCAVVLPQLVFGCGCRSCSASVDLHRYGIVHQPQHHVSLVERLSCANPIPTFSAYYLSSYICSWLVLKDIQQIIVSFGWMCLCKVKICSMQEVFTICILDSIHYNPLHACLFSTAFIILFYFFLLNNKMAFSGLDCVFEFGNIKLKNTKLISSGSNPQLSAHKTNARTN